MSSSTITSSARGREPGQPGPPLGCQHGAGRVLRRRVEVEQPRALGPDGTLDGVDLQPERVHRHRDERARAATSASIAPA